MERILGKTVYIFGAGASYHAGAPLLKDFLVTARNLMRSNTKLIYKESFNEVFRWLDGLRGSSYYVETDLDNLEHVFSLAEMGAQIGVDKKKEIARYLPDIILETLEKKCTFTVKNPKRFDEIYLNFIKRIKESYRVRKELIKEEFYKPDTIITFNYDIMLELAMWAENLTPKYFTGFEPIDVSKRSLFDQEKLQKSFDEENKPDNLALLKLHGSVLWVKCTHTHCEKFDKFQNVRFDDLFGNQPCSNGTYPIQITEILKNIPCQHCNTAGTLKNPLIIPPTWSKDIKKFPNIANVWNKAVEDLRDASQIVVIGYSMPGTDTFFQYLLALGLAENSNLHRIIIVNPDKSEDFKNRYKKIFSRSLFDREKLFFLPFSFKEFVLSHAYNFENIFGIPFILPPGGNN